MTYLRVNRDLLISIVSLAYLPSAPVYVILSDPARSTRVNLDVRILSGLVRSTLSIFSSRIE
jgi:hypothetical protein